MLSDTILLVSYNNLVLMSVVKLRSGCCFNIITTSSKAVLPARSPIPLIVHSIWRAPLIAPAIELAVAKPKSLWQWQDKITLCIPFTFSRKYLILAPYSSGKQ